MDDSSSAGASSSSAGASSSSAGASSSSARASSSSADASSCKTISSGGSLSGHDTSPETPRNAVTNKRLQKKDGRKEGAAKRRVALKDANEIDLSYDDRLDTVEEATEDMHIDCDSEKRQLASQYMVGLNALAKESIRVSHEKPSTEVVEMSCNDRQRTFDIAEAKEGSEETNTEIISLPGNSTSTGVKRPLQLSSEKMQKDVAASVKRGLRRLNQDEIRPSHEKNGRDDDSQRTEQRREGSDPDKNEATTARVSYAKPITHRTPFCPNFAFLLFFVFVLLLFSSVCYHVGDSALTQRLFNVFGSGEVAKRAEEERILAEKEAEEAAKRDEKEKLAAEKIRRDHRRKQKEEMMAVEKKFLQDQEAARRVKEERIATEIKAKEERLEAARKAEEERIATEKKKEEEWLQKVKKAEEEVFTGVTEMDGLNAILDDMEKIIQVTMDKLLVWEKALIAAEKAIKENNINDLTTMPHIKIVGVLNLNDLQVPGERCAGEHHDFWETYVTKSRFEEIKHDIFFNFVKDVRTAVKNDTRLSLQVNMTIEDYEAEILAKQPGFADTPPQSLSMTNVTKAIEQIMANKTGTVLGPDYASIRLGAHVLKCVTSPSLVDNLSPWNKLSHNLCLRYYGGPPESALSVTYPPDALGQCWLVGRRDGKEEQRGVVIGNFATLGIRLSHAIRPTAVVIEHPSRELSDKVGSAVKDFRVWGFENEDGTGEKYDWGRYIYRIDANRSVQTFEIPRHTNEQGNKVPVVRSVVLIIDSNWGEEYICLYRVRVHGEQITYTTSIEI